MNLEPFMQNAHLLLGLSRKELARRISSGQVDAQILKAQVEQNAKEIRLSTLCEKWIELHSLDQVEHFLDTE